MVMVVVVAVRELVPPSTPCSHAPEDIKILKFRSVSRFVPIECSVNTMSFKTRK